MTIWSYSDSGSAYNWWERSPNSGNSTNFCNVNSDGSVNNDNASNSRGLAPFGCFLNDRESSESEISINKIQENMTMP